MDRCGRKARAARQPIFSSQKISLRGPGAPWSSWEETNQILRGNKTGSKKHIPSQGMGLTCVELWQCSTSGSCRARWLDPLSSTGHTRISFSGWGGALSLLPLPSLPPRQRPLCSPHLLQPCTPHLLLRPFPPLLLDVNCHSDGGHGWAERQQSNKKRSARARA